MAETMVLPTSVDIPVMNSFIKLLFNRKVRKEFTKSAKKLKLINQFAKTKAHNNSKTSDISSFELKLCKQKRNRSCPSGTVGDKIALTSKPFSCN
ncbi:hypothetical protein D3C84_1116860 [compost metagenome]